MAEHPSSHGSRAAVEEPRISGAGSETSPVAARPASGYSMYEEEGVSGWGLFTGFVIGLVGLFQFITGIAELAGSGQHAVPSRELIVDVGTPPGAGSICCSASSCWSRVAASPLAAEWPGWPASSSRGSARW